MTPLQTTTDAGRRSAPIRRPTLLLAPGTIGNTSTDGTWWPYSRDLSAELPDLLAALGNRLGPIHRVVYHLDEWDTAPRKLQNAGRRVRLDGYRHKPSRTLDILGVGGTRITVLVSPPRTDADSARASMMDTANPHGTPTTGDPLGVADIETIGAQQCWDSEGGAGAR
ncbi:DUF5994 family protein [Nocardia sp. 2YAB30]|uniref:DUF5994 family protein n=1 Tax=unclassified Nocardia TaxID=2637762 RepID=UPI003F970A26